MTGYRLGVDIGGTFTDIVLLDEGGALRNKKILSTPDDYSRAIDAGVRELLATSGVAASDIVELAHGTTVETWGAAGIAYCARRRPRRDTTWLEAHDDDDGGGTTGLQPNLDLASE